MKRFLTIFFTLPTFAVILPACTNSEDDPQSAVLKEYDPSQPGEQQPATNQPPPVKLAVATEPVSESPAPLPPIVPFERWDMPETAAEALGRIGAAAVPQLAQALRDPNPLVRKRAADILARIGPDARDAVPVLIQALDDPEEDVRKAAVRALGEIGPAAEEAVPHLIDALREPAKINATP